VEVDLIVDRPGKPYLFIEIKSSDDIRRNDISSFINITKDFPNCEAVCLSRDPDIKRYEHVTVMPWREGLMMFFDIENIAQN